MPEKQQGPNRRRFLAGTAIGVGGSVLVESALLSGTALATEAGGGPVAATSSATTVCTTDIQYPDLVIGLNPRWTARPDNVYVVDAPEQIAPIVAGAISQGKKITVRGGGHCFEDFVYSGDAKVIIDLTNMNRIYYDAATNSIAMETGATLLDVYEKLYQTWGTVIPAGVCYSVGLGGHVAGGGWGWLVRRNGIVVDHLYAVEVVTVNSSGQVKTVLATREASDPNRDLWWAHTGGGGGNFGVITRYFFRSPGATGTDPRKLLPNPPAKVLFNATGWNLNNLTEAQFSRLLINYGSWHAANLSPSSPGRDLACLFQVFHKSNGEIIALTQIDAATPNAQSIMDSFIAHLANGAAPPLFTQTTPMPWLQFMKYTSTANPLANDPTLRAEYKSAFMKQPFTATQAATIYRHFTRSDVSNKNLNLILSPYGGATASVPQADTAIQHRDAAYKALWAAPWSNPADDAVNIAWARQVYYDVYADTGGVPVPNAASDGAYLNYCDADLSDGAWNRSSTPWHGLYYKGAYPRLQQVKLRYDPRNVFRHRQSIQLPS
jgi:hypothetical protein